MIPTLPTACRRRVIEARVDPWFPREPPPCKGSGTRRGIGAGHGVRESTVFAFRTLPAGKARLRCRTRRRAPDVEAEKEGFEPSKEVNTPLTP